MKEFLDHFEKLLGAFKDPEYLFLVLEPVLFYGIGIGVIGLIAAWFLKNERLQLASLIVIAVSALAIFPYLGARESAQKRIVKVYEIESPTRAKAFSTNTADRIDHKWIYLALAGVAGAAILVGPRRNRLGLGLAIGAVVLGLHGVNYSLWMHYQDSLAFHPNLKTNDAPVKEKLRAKPIESTVEKSTPAPKPAPAAADDRIPAPTPPREIRPLARPIAAGGSGGQG
ncbi:MAG: hypothetical protein KDM91_14905 [Verrucomicrobiae bacterium]|nr:hypothetical protein [Verrucomicrobiae bacterium]